MTASVDVDIDALVAETDENLKVNDLAQAETNNNNNNNNNNNHQNDDSKNGIDEPANANNDIPAASIEIDSKQKKKLDKFLDNLFKRNNLNTLKTIDEKFYALANIYSDLVEQNKNKDNQLKESQKNITVITKQRDQLQHDHSKALLARNKLESLCRELQRHNKAIKEENLNRAKEEEDKRKEISTKFQAAIDEINQQVNANNERNNSLLNENHQLTGKLKSLIEQYDAREQQVEKILKHKDLENQLMVAKFQQSELRVAELSERSKHAEEIINELNKKCEYYAKAEEQLKGQLKVYTEKYEEFQTTLNKSNEVFGSFRSEMDKMTKKIKKLEQETNLWKTRWESSNSKLLQVTEQKEAIEKETKKQQLRADKLEQLSRTLQTERTNLIQQLKQYEDVNKTSNNNKAPTPSQEQPKQEPKVTEPENATDNNKTNESSESQKTDNNNTANDSSATSNNSNTDTAQTSS